MPPAGSTRNRPDSGNPPAPPPAGILFVCLNLDLNPNLNLMSEPPAPPQAFRNRELTARLLQCASVLLDPVHRPN